MRLTWRDALATVFVLMAVAVYALWLAGVEVFGMSSVRAIGLVVLGLGLAASVVAVVYGVGAGLLDASRIYLVVTSLLGLGALIAGVVVLAAESEPMLAALVIATGAMWILATVRHARLATTEHGSERGTPELRHAA
jgi:hypothetical protein